MRQIIKIQIILIVVVLFAVSIPLQLRATRNPDYCASCHEMKPTVTSFRSSTHAAVGCTGCHSNSGQVNSVVDKIRDGAKDLYGHFFGYHKPIRADVPNERCLTCHPTIQKRNRFRQLDVAHDRHMAQNIKCSECHLRVGHQRFTIASATVELPSPASFEASHRIVTQQTCFKSGCHDNKVATTACIACHVEQQRVMPSTHELGFIVKHGKQARTAPDGCLTCHKAEPMLTSASESNPSKSKAARFHQLLAGPFCRDCHTKRNPHPETFLGSHGAMAQSEKANCQVCHQKEDKFCTACHGMAMPHPEGFLSYHGAMSKRMEKKCELCHKKESCDSCHYSTRPPSHVVDFRVKHGPIAKKNVQNCLMCHRQTTCDACHQLTMPHPEQYALNHTEEATQKESACANCHKKDDCLVCHKNEEIHLPNVRLEGERNGVDPVRKLVNWLARGNGDGCPAMRDKADSPRLSSVRAVSLLLSNQSAVPEMSNKVLP